MIYTARFAHLARKPNLNVGAVVRKGDLIGIMGSTGASEADHLHFDATEGNNTHRYSLGEIALGKPKASPRETFRFINKWIFGVYPVVTTGYADADYQKQYNKYHLAVDLVPEDRKETKDHYEIRWPIDAPGRVGAILENDPGYGNAAQIAYEAP